jgi:two-component system sensor histidine kinase/response regulator
VDNGLAALKALAKGSFDLVLMDVQMPEMDGFAATAAIREQERSTGKHLPIVAMTARAMKGDREACFAAGMDGYVAKPLHSQQLFDVIDRVLKGPSPAAGRDSNASGYRSTSNADTPMTAEDSDRELPVIDFDSLLERVEQDSSLMAEMIELYLQTASQLLAELEMGVRRQEPAAVQKAAHALKGALRNLSAAPSAQAAMQLEADAELGSLDSAEKNLEVLRREMLRLQQELAHWSKEVCV